MKPLLRWIGIALGSLFGLGIVAYAVLYILSERVLRRTYEIPAVSLLIPTDPHRPWKGSGWPPFVVASLVAMAGRLREGSCSTNR